MAAPNVASVSCPNCGGSVTLRGCGQSLTAVCIQCLSVLDVRNPQVAILQRFEAAERIKPAIPLGTRGKLEDTVWEAIGFQVREIEVDDVTYSWREYLLINPYKGFRYLSEYDGHWNFIHALPGVPEDGQVSGRPVVQYGIDTYRHFQTSTARTSYVMGEFPWQVKVGETVQVCDYIKPPSMLSAEITENEVAWSQGDYVEPEVIWQAFKLPGHPIPRAGVFADQPAPGGKAVATSKASMWRAFLILAAALLVVSFGVYAFSGRKELFHQTYTFTSTVAPATEPSDTSGVAGSSGATGPSGATGQTADTGVTTPQFDIAGGSGNVEIEVRTNLDNDWAYFNLALINTGTGQVHDFGREVSYYHGSDSDGSWSEGSDHESVAVLGVGAGKYYLRIDPEMETKEQHFVRYEVTVRRDVPSLGFFWVALALLILPPIFRSRAGGGSNFEAQRWSQSDYGS